MKQTGTELVKRGMAEMQKGGVIMDVINAEQAKIAEAAGAVAVMALERSRQIFAKQAVLHVWLILELLRRLWGCLHSGNG